MSHTRLTITETFFINVVKVLYTSDRVIMIGFGSTVFSSSSSAPKCVSSGSTEATAVQLSNTFISSTTHRQAPNPGTASARTV